MHEHNYKAYSMLLFICIVWGISFPIMDSLLQHISPMLFVSIRYGLSAIALSVLFPNKIKTLRIYDIKYGLYVGIPFAFAVSLQMLGLQHSSPTNVAFITGMTAVVVPLLHWLLDKVLPTKTLLLAIVLSFVGLFIMSGVFASGGVQISDSIVLVGTVAFALQIIHLEKLGKVDYTKITLIQFYSSALLSLLFMFCFETVQFKGSTTIYMQLFFIVMICSVLALLIQNKYQHHINSTEVGIIFLSEPVSAILFSLFLGIQITWNQWLGASIILIALCIAIVGIKQNG